MKLEHSDHFLVLSGWIMYTNISTLYPFVVMNLFYCTVHGELLVHICQQHSK
jgi:hypothetical protein